ncbi:MAG: hypothetical protein DMF10_05850 [Verrucomicrobia bacterium]|nr:MAG: hypothetical protein DMF10_05850 [Verrucomicrobiota bacterium]
MNDFSELENELKKLRPAQPSPILFERVEEAMGVWRAGASPARQPKRSPYNWLSLGLGLAAAAVLFLFATINMERTQERREKIAQISPAPETSSVLRRRIAVCTRLRAAAAPSSLSNASDVAVAQSDHWRITSCVLSQRGGRPYSGFRSMI